MHSSANDLRTLILINYENLHFTHALDPEQNPSNLALCCNMEELVLYFQYWTPHRVKPLIRMAENRASRGAKLSSITLVDLHGDGLREGVLELEEHFAHVEYRVGGATPGWDDVPGESDGSEKYR